MASYGEGGRGRRNLGRERTGADGFGFRFASAKAGGLVGWLLLYGVLILF